MEREQRVVIVGGGISGLAAAHRLETLQAADDVLLLETDTRLGGKIVTDRIGRYVIEGGPDSFLTSKPRGVGLCGELGIEDELIPTNEHWRRSFVTWEGRLHQMPEGLTGLVPSRLEPVLQSDLFTAQGKNRLSQEPVIPPRVGTEDETLASFMERRFGTEVYDRLIEPLMAGIYAGDGRELSLLATFPQLRRLEQEHGSLVGGIAAQQTASVHAPAPRPGFVSFRTGMAALVEALTARFCRTRILCGQQAASLSREGQGIRVTLASGDTIQAQAVILANPAWSAAPLVEGLHPALAHELAGMSWVSSATISLAFPSSSLPRQLDGFGYVVPRKESRPALACTWTSTKFPNRAPDGYSLLRVFIGRAGQPVDAYLDEKLVEIAQAELAAVMDITAQPALVRIYRWPQGMPQYTLGHLQRLARIAGALETTRGLFLAGASYRGVGIPDCIASGEAAAEATQTQLA